MIRKISPLPFQRFGILVLICIGQITYSQKFTRGVVVDATDSQPLSGAYVIGISGQETTITDKEGRFLLELNQSINQILIKYLGYEDIAIKVDALQEDLGVIALQRSRTGLPEVLVSASPRSYNSIIKGSNYRINSVALQNQNPVSTEEALRTVPGVNIIGDMGLSNRPNISIRGSWGRRSKKILLLEDGSPAAPAPYIAPGAYYNPVSDRIIGIEVYKGSDLLRFGPNNMYGAINYITALPPQKPELRLKWIGGQQQYRTGLFSYGGTWNNLGALVEGVYKKFDGFTKNSGVEVLNLNAKIYSKLSESQSLYFKVSGQFEDNQASLSSITPFTFEANPRENPLDADEFIMRRYGLDLIHKYLINKNIGLTSKIYTSDFERDWWRQVTQKIKASEVRNYVGEAIYKDKYDYLEGLNYGDEDYVIVGQIKDGLESTTDSRWIYTVSGLKQTLTCNWGTDQKSNQLEVGYNVHRETFKDRFLQSNYSRWARSGSTTKDLWYRLWSANGYLRNEFKLRNFNVTPIMRLEYVDMYRQDLLELSRNTDLQNTNTEREANKYLQFLPGLNLDYNFLHGQIFGSIYQGMIAPSKVFGFLVSRNGVVTNPFDGASINIKPELAWNRELGWRGTILAGLVEGQLTYFNNTSRNFYAGGRNEVFEQLGRINIKGVELAIGAKVFKGSKGGLDINTNLNLMQSRVLEGVLLDKDLFSEVVHNSRTQREYLQKVNTNRQAYDIFIQDPSGNEVLLDKAVLDTSDFPAIVKSAIHFGNDKVTDAQAPYTPKYNLNVGLTYNRNDWSVGLTSNWVGSQFTEFHNFESESADGAIGKLRSYNTLDAFLNHEFNVGTKVRARAFINGKNITNKIYKASRLNRATSGIFGGGYRLLIFGIDLSI